MEIDTAIATDGGSLWLGFGELMSIHGAMTREDPHLWTVNEFLGVLQSRA